MDAATQDNSTAKSPGAWRLDWLTPGRCRAILVGLILFGFFSHLRYLRNNCPIDLSGDEAQYWEWSRQLDWSYYSKGPLVAYIIRASTAVFGSTMWAVRLPALVLAGITSLLTYWLTLRLFKSERLALGAVLINHIVPMFIAGSLFMTIDPPYFLCWGLATAFFALAVLEDRRWPWIGVGIAMGLGILAKYGMLLWPLGMLAFLVIDARSRKWLATPWPYLAVLIGLVFLAPPIIWNIQHDWVTFKHVAKQTGATHQARWFNGNFLEFVGSQLGVMGPALAPIVIGAVVYAFRRQTPRTPAQQDDRAAVLLMWMGLPLMILCIMGSIRSKMQINWPASAYFSWMILAAYFLSTRLADLARWKRWRGLFWGAVMFGVTMMPIAHDTSLLYPLIPVINKFRKKPVDAQAIDMTYRLKGWEELGQRVSQELKQVSNGFVLCRDYMQTAEMAFYVEGQPKTFCIGPYIKNLKERKRRTQLDVWPDRSLAQPSLRGRDAIYVGYFIEDLKDAFESVEPLPPLIIDKNGHFVRRFQLFRCRGFKGMQLQEAGGEF